MTTRSFGCRLKLYPTRAQAARFALWAAAGSELRDLLLERDLARYRETGKCLSLRGLQEVVYEFAAAHPSLGWPARTRNEHARDHGRAMRMAFKRLKAGKRGGAVGWPMPRRGRPAAIYVHNQTLRVNGRYARLSMAGHGWTRYRGRIPDGDIMSGRIRRDGPGWALSLSMRARMPAYVEPKRGRCDVVLGGGVLATVSDGRGTTVYPDVEACREDAGRKEATLKRRVARRCWRCTECGGLMRSDVRAGLLSRDKRQAPCGHWIVGYERTERLKRAEAAVRKMRRKTRNRRRNAVHNATIAIVRNYRDIAVTLGQERGQTATECIRQLGYKSEWHGRKLTAPGTAA